MEHSVGRQTVKYLQTGQKVYTSLPNMIKLRGVRFAILIPQVEIDHMPECRLELLLMFTELYVLRDYFLSEVDSSPFVLKLASKMVQDTVHIDRD